MMESFFYSGEGFRYWSMPWFWFQSCFDQWVMGPLPPFFFFFFWDIPIGRKPWLRAFTKSWARPHFKMDYSSPPQKRLVILKAFMLPKKTNKKTDCIFQKKKKKKDGRVWWCFGVTSSSGHGECLWMRIYESKVDDVCLVCWRWGWKLDKVMSMLDQMMVTETWIQVDLG